MSRLGLVVVGLGWLVRPELLVDSVVFVALVLIFTWRAATWPGRLGAVLWATGLPLAYQIFRMGYYGSTVANTAIAKEGSRLRLDAGWSYFQDFVRPYWLWMPVVILVAGVYAPLAIRLMRTRHTRAVGVLAAFVLAAAGNAGGVVAFGGDYLHGRLLLPALFAFCAPIAVVPATARYVASLGALAWATVCLVALRPPETRSPFVVPQEASRTDCRRHRGESRSQTQDGDAATRSSRCSRVARCSSTRPASARRTSIGSTRRWQPACPSRPW